MRIDGPRRIARPIPLTPLIDVVFLLLMFFMLSTTFAKFGLFGMSGAVREEGSETAAGAVPGVLIEVRAGPLLRVNGTTLALGELVPELNSLHASGVTEGIIRIRKDARVQDLLTVLEVARTSKLRTLSLSK